MNNLAALKQEDRKLSIFQQYTEEELAIIKDQVAKGATDLELKFFLQYCNEHNLSAILREVWFIKYGPNSNKPPIIMVGRDGYLKNANRHPDFQGIQSGAIYKGDHFVPNYNTGEIDYAPKFESKDIVAGWAVAYRKGCKPQIKVCQWDDYVKSNSDAWKNSRPDMIIKCAESRALARQFPIEGATPGEEEEIERIKNITPEKQGEDKAKEKVDPLNDITEQLTQNNQQEEHAESEEVKETPEDFFARFLDENFDRIHQHYTEAYGEILPYDSGKELIKPCFDFMKGNINETAMYRTQKDPEKFIAKFCDYLAKQKG